MHSMGLQILIIFKSLFLKVYYLIFFKSLLYTHFFKKWVYNIRGKPCANGSWDMQNKGTFITLFAKLPTRPSTSLRSTVLTASIRCAHFHNNFSNLVGSKCSSSNHPVSFLTTSVVSSLKQIYLLP